MINEDDIIQLDAILSTPPENLCYAQVLFLFHVIPDLTKFNIVPKCKSLLTKEKVKRIYKALAIIVDNMEEKLNFATEVCENTIIEELLSKIPEVPSKDFSDSVKDSSVGASIVPESDILKTLHDNALSINYGEYISSDETFFFETMAQKKMIPTEFLLLLSNLPMKFPPSAEIYGNLLPTIFYQYINKKIKLLQSVLNNEFTLQIDYYNKMRKEVIPTLNKTYSLDVIAEGEHYSLQKYNLWKKYGVPDKNLYFINDDHRRLFCERLECMKIQQKLSKSALATKSGISRPTIDTYLDPGKNPKNDKDFIASKTLYAFAEALGCTADYLFGNVHSPVIRIDATNIPLRRAIFKQQENHNYLTMAKRSRKNCTSTIEKLLDADHLLFQDDFKKIGEYIDTLINAKKSKTKQRKVKKTTEDSNSN